MKEELQKISLFFFLTFFYWKKKNQSFNIGMEMKGIASCSRDNLTAEICQECESSEEGEGGEKKLEWIKDDSWKENMLISYENPGWSRVETPPRMDH